jgi:BlaI family transcriptional regulator, penicillinase repressor
MEKLTIQEEQAMQALWEVQKGNIKTILQAIAEPQPPYTTLASTVKNLEKKEFVSSELLGNQYVYTPAVNEKEYKKKFMQGFIADYFENSYKELVTFFATEKKISSKELKEIIEQIEKGKDSK